MKVGFLLHVYNLGCKDWEELVWGIPAQDKLGTGAKLFECLLDEPAANEVTAIIYDGPSSKDGVAEGEYTRRFLVKNLANMAEFPRFKRRLLAMPPSNKALLERRARAVTLGAPIQNTLDEIKNGARDFHMRGIDKIVHIAAASHSPRCIQLQLVAREHGWIPPGQRWFTVGSDLAFAGTTAEDVFIAEPPHRADDPLLKLHPDLAKLLKPFYSLPFSGQKRFLLETAKIMAQAINMQSADLNVNHNRRV